MAYPRILFFINSVSPTLEEQMAADQLAPCRVSFRNASFVPNSGALEDCAGWFGDATPKAYRDKFPPADEAIKAFIKKREADFEAKQAKAEAAKKAVVDRAADEAEKLADKAAKEAEEAKEKAKAATKVAKAKKTAAGAATVAAENAANQDPTTAAPTVEAAAQAANSWAPNS